MGTGRGMVPGCAGYRVREGNGEAACTGRADGRLWDSWEGMEADEVVWGKAMEWFRDVA